MAKAASEHVLALVKAGISAVPVVGGPIASLIGDYIPMATRRNIQFAIDELADRLSQLEHRLDPESVDKEEFAELFKSCYLIIIRTHNSQRRRAAVSLLTNILLREGDDDRLSYTELDHFVRCLETLSIGAIDVLGCAMAISRERTPIDLERNYFRFNFSDLQQRLPTVDAYLLMGLVGELNTVNLIHQPGTPGVREAKNLYGNYPLELTPLGARFVTRLLER